MPLYWRLLGCWVCWAGAVGALQLVGRGRMFAMRRRAGASSQKRRKDWRCSHDEAAAAAQEGQKRVRGRRRFCTVPRDGWWRSSGGRFTNAHPRAAASTQSKFTSGLVGRVRGHQGMAAWGWAGVRTQPGPTARLPWSRPFRARPAQTPPWSMLTGLIRRRCGKTRALDGDGRAGAALALPVQRPRPCTPSEKAHAST
ncbi:hypothetical protein BKA66DRAFT_550713 [Pyrenochaeta sp. MPI-SDFR-AT-0127]|nr:hypothetical protein BKA66DRAFT_550713 [Pyrenochaeta sp. MPI-SDFR-AT-0127]